MRGRPFSSRPTGVGTAAPAGSVRCITAGSCCKNVFAIILATILVINDVTPVSGQENSTGIKSHDTTDEGECDNLRSSPVPEPVDVFGLRLQQCPIEDSGPGDGIWSGGRCIAETGQVVELNETSLSELLEALRSEDGKLSSAYVAVLYYATWCPFSRELLPTFKALAEIHPSILHVAVEERAVRPSVLSQVGVHSFPALYVHNRTVRIKYHGLRTLPKLQRFYANITDVQQPPAALEGDWAQQMGGRHAESGGREPCPYPWAQHPEQLLQENACLLLASAFVFLRGVFWVTPRAVQWLSATWRARVQRVAASRR